MPTIRAHTVDVIAQVRAQLALDAQSAAGSNTLLSKAEQGALADGDVLKSAADDVRAQSSRVTVDVLVDAAEARVQSQLGAVNKKTPDFVSKSEVKALAAVDLDSATRVAKAYEIITGKHIDLSGASPSPDPAPPPPGKPPKPPQPPATPGPVTGSLHVTPPASNGNALAIANLVVTAGSSNAFQANVVGNALEMKGLAGGPGTVDLDVGGVHVHLDLALNQPSARSIGGMFEGRDVVEGLRAALPASLDIRVAALDRGTYVVDFFPKGTTPPVDNAPQYGALFINGGVGGIMTGPLAVKMGNGPLGAGDTFSFRVDDKVYTATAQSASATPGALLRDLQAQMEADGRTVVVKDYGRFGMCSLRVTG